MNRSDRRAPPDASDIAAMIYRLPVFGPEEIKVLVQVIASRANDIDLIGVTAVVDHLDAASDAAEAMHDETDEERAERIEDMRQEMKFEEGRDGNG